MIPVSLKQGLLEATVEFVTPAKAGSRASDGAVALDSAFAGMTKWVCVQTCETLLGVSLTPARTPDARPCPSRVSAVALMISSSQLIFSALVSLSTSGVRNASRLRA